MRFSWQEPGFVVSGIGHTAVLVASLFALSSAPPFAEHEEAIAVDMVSESELRALTKGLRTAKDVQPEPKPRADKVAALVDEKPDPGEAKRDIPAPPVRSPEAAPAEKAAVASPPSQRPEPIKQPEPKLEPAKVEPKPDLPKDADIPEPPRRPEPLKAEERPKPEKKPELKPQPNKVELARLLEELKPEDKPKTKPAEPDQRFNPTDIRQLLESKERAQTTASTGRELNRTAALGIPTGNASKLSLSQRDALGALLKEQLANCWTPPMGVTANLKPLVHMKLNPDGSLLAQPALVNASGEPSFRVLAESAMRAVRRCAPFRIPASYAPYYADWQEWNIIFDPKEFLG